MNSLEQRLQTGLFVSLILLMALGGWGVSTATRNIATELLATRLEHDAESLLSALQPPTENGALRVQSEAISAIYDRPYSGHYYVIRFNGDELRSRSLWDAALTVPRVAAGEGERREIEGPDGQQLLLWSGGYRRFGQNVTVSVAEDLTALTKSLTELRWLLAVATLLSLLLLGVMLRWVIVTTFRPLRHVSGDIDRLANGERSQLDENVPAEVQPLVVEVNRLLALLDQRLRRSRNATGNLAHALKTPLTLLRQLAERPDLDGLPQCRKQLRQQVDRLQKLVDVELKRARIAGQGSVGQRFVPRRDIPDLVAVLEKAYGEKKPVFDLRITAAGELLADRDDMLELVGNLLDNACKWAQGRVRCAFFTDPDTTLVIEDDGPGCTPVQLDKLTQRGRRVDENAPGHGLGLAIAAEIAETYGARLALDRSEALGGLRVRVVFPGSAMSGRRAQYPDRSIPK